MENKPFLGDFTKSAFKFDNSSINHVQVFVNSESHSQRSCTPDFSKDLYNSEYFALFANLDQSHMGFGTIDIEHSEFLNNNCFFAFDFTADKALVVVLAHI